MRGTVVVDGTASSAGVEAVRSLVAAGTPFWLDLDGVDDDASGLLLHDFGFHPLAVEDAEHFGQRPKIDEFDDCTYFVVHGAQPDGSGVAEVHIFLTPHSVVTVHRGECQALADVHHRLARHHAGDDASPQVTLLYIIVDSLVDGFFPVLSRFDDRIDALEDDILRQPTEEQLGVLFDMKRSLIAMRKVVTPQRDMFAALSSGVVRLPGMTTESERYFRDLYDHLIRIADVVDGYRDLLSGVMDTHVSTVSNRLYVVMKQLTIIATIFLPLSYLTGFFGQNFSFLVGHITGRAPFVFFGLGLEVLAALILLYFFRRRGWLGGPTT
ncbi:MAG TPA: magnesium transporter CorA family protein [Acidimicrobiales bacterium]|nr:magnesium transporter CorA family protein [Acidimicrobiales bacterium]